MSKALRSVIVLSSLLVTAAVYASARGPIQCKQILDGTKVSPSVDSVDGEILKKFEPLEVREISDSPDVSKSPFAQLDNLNPSSVTDYLGNYFTQLPEGLLLGTKDFIYNIIHQHKVRPEVFLMNQRKAVKARLWRNHLGFFIHGALAATLIAAPELLTESSSLGTAFACINAYCAFNILVKTKALKRRHRLFQVLGYIK